MFIGASWSCEGILTTGLRVSTLTKLYECTHIQYSGPLYSGHLWIRKDVLITEMSSIRRLKMYYSLLYIVDYVVPVACVHIRRVSVIQGSWLDGSTVH